MKLTATKVKTAKPTEKDYKLSDGRGLHLLVKKNGSKYWRYSFRFANKQKTLPLGVYPDISLADARQKLEEARRQLANDIDPTAVKRVSRASTKELANNTFELVALEWFEKKMHDKSESHRSRTIRSLERDVFPFLGRISIGQISAPELLTVLRKIEGRGAIETAHRAKQTCGQILRYAIATGRAERDVSADLKDALKTASTKHFAAITTPEEVGRLILAIDGYHASPVVSAALRLSPLLLCRPGELRHMEWAEINWEESRWEIPGEKMKMKSPHIVPLSSQAITLLKELHPLTAHRGKYVFPSARGASRPLSENGVRTALRSMGYDNETMTPHGFRAMARTLLDEELGYRIEWIECQLAHAVKDANGRAYNRTTYLKQRTEMMQRWADYLGSLRYKAASGITAETLSFLGEGAL